MANLCFEESTDIMSTTVERALTDDAEFQDNRFILACREFQKGLTNLAALKKEYTKESLLKF